LEKDYQNIIKNAPDIIFTTDEEGRFNYVNEYMCDFFKVNSLDIIGKPFTHFVHPEDKRKVFRFYNNQLRNKLELSYLEFRVIDAKNIVSWVGQNVRLISSENNEQTYTFQATSRDITEKKELEMRLQQFSLIAEKTINFIIIADKNEQVTWVNNSFTKLMGFTQEEILGKNAAELLRGPLTNDLSKKQIGEIIDSKSSSSVEIINYTKSGAPIWLSLQIDCIFNDENEFVQYVTVGQDITERKNKEAIIESQNLDIKNSINYAKRIQKALLTNESFLNSLPIDYALWYKPKDVIGGDFYWADKIYNKIVFAIGDCTGHGVPGAIMTSLGINGLINCVTEQKQTDPSKILTYLNDYILNILSTTSHDDKVDDGMDLAIVTIDMDTQSVTFSGAGRPLIYISNNELVKIDGSKRSIGAKHILTPFENQVMENAIDKTFYLFSDGMVDQFGGDNMKRIGSKKLLDQFLTNSKLNLSDQKIKLKEYFKNYMINSPQTDDMVWLTLKLKS